MPSAARGTAGVMLAAVSAGRAIAISGASAAMRRKDALRLAEMALARLPARQDLRQAQVHAAELGLRLAIQLGRVRGAAGLVGDQRGVQRVDAAEPLAVDEGPQCRQRGIGAALALLRPGDQQRLQQLRQALARQRAEPLLGRLPMAGPHLGLAQQQLRRLAVRQLRGRAAPPRSGRRSGWR